MQSKKTKGFAKDEMEYHIHPSQAKRLDPSLVGSVIAWIIYSGSRLHLECFAIQHSTHMYEIYIYTIYTIYKQNADV